MLNPAFSKMANGRKSYVIINMLNPAFSKMANGRKSSMIINMLNPAFSKMSNVKWSITGPCDKNNMLRHFHSSYRPLFMHVFFLNILA